MVDILGMSGKLAGDAESLIAWADAALEFDASARTMIGEAFVSYLAWCADKERAPCSRHVFTRELRRRGAGVGRQGSGRYLIGLALKPRTLHHY